MKTYIRIGKFYSQWSKFDFDLSWNGKVIRFGIGKKLFSERYGHSKKLFRLGKFYIDKFTYNEK